jgi:hypothetical protein
MNRIYTRYSKRRIINKKKDRRFIGSRKIDCQYYKKNCCKLNIKQQINQLIKNKPSQKALIYPKFNRLLTKDKVRRTSKNGVSHRLNIKYKYRRLRSWQLYFISGLKKTVNSQVILVLNSNSNKSAKVQLPIINTITDSVVLLPISKEKIQNNVKVVPSKKSNNNLKHKNTNIHSDILVTDITNKNLIVKYPKPKQVGKEDFISVPSIANDRQNNDIRIQYRPTDKFSQHPKYKYPVVKMPISNARVKLPRIGRSTSKGYKEDAFTNALKENLTNIDISTDYHLSILQCPRPYEPDIVLYDEKLNLYIDIEIDEPYDGYYKTATHEIEKDDNRDLYFIESGWIVIRFTEKQVHEQEQESIQFIKNVLHSIHITSEISHNSNITLEEQWSRVKAEYWAQISYREKYLGIPSFHYQNRETKVLIDSTCDQEEAFENVIKRTQIHKSTYSKDGISFDEDKHAYFPDTNKTGNANYISVTTLIDQFFPFNEERYIKNKAKRENRSIADVRREVEIVKNDASNNGTILHKTIEDFLNNNPVNTNIPEFKYFNNFYKKEILSRNLQFVSAEHIVTLDEYLIAGTIDALFKKPNGEYIIVDWKRSKKLIIDGYSNKMGHGSALSILSHLSNSSYTKYELQQSFYKYMIEKKYNIKVSSMILAVLHRSNPDYDTIKLTYREKEVKEIIRSLNDKI